jgi:hypothetical protein
MRCAFWKRVISSTASHDVVHMDHCLSGPCVCISNVLELRPTSALFNATSRVTVQI